MKLPVLMRSIVKFYAPKQALSEQITCITDSSPQILLGHIAATLFVLVVIHGTPQSLAAIPWGVLMIGAVIPNLRLLQRLGSQAREKTAEVAAKVAVIAGSRGMLWSMGMVSIMPNQGQLVSAELQLVMFGMLVGGILNYWVFPLAALTYSSLMVVGLITAIIRTSGFQDGFASASLIFVAFLYFNRMALAYARDFRSKVDAVKRLKDKKEVVSLLLRDFEESTRDWLWEIDSEGMLVRGADGFSSAFGIAASCFEATPVLKVIQDLSDKHHQSYGVKQLIKYLSGEIHFSDCEVSINFGESTVYLSLTAKPDFDVQGKKFGWRGVCANISAARSAEASVLRLAQTDTLTGLPNRARLRKGLEDIIESCDGVERYVAFADLDGFKGVNDLMGHAAGDHVLCALTARFSRLLKPSELIARIGGDEFVFVLERSLIEIEMVWHEIVKQASEPVYFMGQPQHVGVSLGIVALDPSLEQVDEVLRRADMALYKAKNQGRGTARFYTREMDEYLTERRELESALRAAVSAKCFELRYQPIFSCRTGELCSYEALIRWHDPKHGCISPSVFIPLAEECGLISEIGVWVLQQACKDARSFAPGVSVSVNISAVQMRSRRLLIDVTTALAESGLPAHLLEIEMTETALADNSGLPEMLTNDLKALGVQLALDDFGTGYSSLSYLHRFKFNRIKIDQSFVQAYDTRKSSRAVVNAILALSKQLKISVTAEGIETAEQNRLMAAKGMDRVQGFFLGKPRPLQDIFKSKVSAIGAA